MKSEIDRNLMPLSIRRLDLEKDFPIFYEWLKHEYVSQDNPAEFNYNSLLGSYQSNEGSTFAESCMVCSGDDPVMEVDIIKGDMHEVYPFY
ncbi:MAG TPA: acetyltransferase, partial [Niastella sp.]